MYPHPELHSYLQGFNARMPKKVLDRMVDKAMHNKTTCNEMKPLQMMRLTSTQPQCFAPDVDVTRSKCAFGYFAIPKLKRELYSDDPLLVRQTVTTLGDILVSPEKLIEAVELNLPDKLAKFLESEDPYIRERVAMIYATIANQAAGRDAILKNLITIANLLKGFDDDLAAVRLKIAHAVETLARDYCAANMLCACGFVESITAKLCNEKRDILVVHLETLKFLLYRNVKVKAIEGGTFENLMTLLNRKDEEVLCKALSCLEILCEDFSGKQKAIEMDLLSRLKIILEDERESLRTAACRVASFVTISTPGKLRVLELEMTSSLVRLATEDCRCCCTPDLLLAIIKTLTNVAEAPQGRATLLKNVMLIEGIDDGDNQLLREHKQILLNVLCWKP